MSISDSSVPQETYPRRMGCLGVVVLAVVVLFAAWFIWDGVAGALHQSRGREIREMGSDYLAVLDSYNPVKPARGSRNLDRLSDLWENDTDPTGHWEYSGEAIYATDPTGNQFSAQQAYDEFCQYLTDNGWTLYGEPGAGPQGSTRFTRDGGSLHGGWGLQVYLSDEDRVSFFITGANRGGPRPA